MSDDWIDVNDRMPEDSSWVLVFQNGAIDCMAWYRGAWRNWSALFPGGEDTDSNVSRARITHWQPLPAPPSSYKPSVED